MYFPSSLFTNSVFAYLLKFIWNPQIHTNGAFIDICRHTQSDGKKFELL